MARVKIDPNRKFKVTEIDHEFKAITDNQEAARRKTTKNKNQKRSDNQKLLHENIINFEEDNYATGSD